MVCDYIAGMSDRFAIDLLKNYLCQRPGRAEALEDMDVLPG